MSFIPGLSTELSKAWDSTVGAVSGAIDSAGDAVNNTWNWLTGKPTPPPPVKDAEKPAVSVSETPDGDSKPAEVVPSETLAPIDYSKISLLELFAILRAEITHRCLNQARAHHQKASEIHEKQKGLNTLQNLFTKHAANSGSIEFTSPEDLQTLAKGRSLGIPIENKTTFTKDERDAISRTIDNAVRETTDQLNLTTSDVSEAVQTRNTFYQELLTCWNKLVECIRTMIRALSPR